MAASLEYEVEDHDTALRLVSSRSRIVREIRHDEREKWDDFVSSASNSHVMQGWAWGEYKRRIGWKPVRVAVMQGDSIIAAAQLLIRGACGISFGYVPRGPVCSPTDVASYTVLLTALHDHARRRRAIFLRVEPDELAETEVEQLLRKQGFIFASDTMRPTEPWATFLVDLTGDPDAVLARMKKRTRQHAKAGAKKFVLRAGTTEADIIAFHELMMELAARKNYAAKPLSYYQKMVQELTSTGRATLMLAEFEGKVIAGIIVLAYGTEGFFWQSAALYDYLGTHVNQYLQWQAMLWCIERGCTVYDMGGVFESRSLDADGKIVYHPIDPDKMDPEEEGLYNYKMGYGGTLVRYIGAFDYPYNRPAYLLYRRLGPLQARGSDFLHTVQNRLEVIFRRST